MEVERWKLIDDSDTERSRGPTEIPLPFIHKQLDQPSLRVFEMSSRRPRKETDRKNLVNRNESFKLSSSLSVLHRDVYNFNEVTEDMDEP